MTNNIEYGKCGNCPTYNSPPEFSRSTKNPSKDFFINFGVTELNESIQVKRVASLFRNRIILPEGPPSSSSMALHFSHEQLVLFPSF